MSLMELEVERQSNPVDMIEFVAATNDWSFERSGEDEIAMTVEGRWADYHVSFSWMEEFEALHLASAFDLKIPDARINEVLKLLSFVNGQVLMGHFDLWRNEDIVIFRQSLLLAGGAEPTNRQVEVLLSSAVEACEAYYQAFQFVVWSGMDAKSAMDAVLFETVGEA
ncbi:YbjN domain-containing protein [Peteryoungia desertarenae]|uniref:YbjN domain-containing protein n=1 Tax=Peteryoungia desertarenae TaxID=1813451 RepID=A0ABX6QR25_9HYPH|nr:YbjN domain-containing protein [Peteryoungia desertarenae]QLF70948.1 YbjN domain-containing protein [Peteryoungia desertarenae]